MEFSLTKMIAALLVIGVRVSGMMLFAPFFSSAAIPPRVKAILVIVITAVLYPLHSVNLDVINTANWLIVVASETVLGIAIGLTTNMVFEAVHIAGQVVSIQVGHSLVNILDPNTEVETAVLGLFKQTIVILIFLTLNVHHWILRAIARSFDYLPPGTVRLGPAFAQALLHDGAIVLDLSVQIAAPVLAATFLIDIALGLLGKASPHMPLMLLGPAVKSMAGVLVLSAAIAYWPRLFEHYFSESIAYTETILHLAH